MNSNIVKYKASVSNLKHYLLKIEGFEGLSDFWKEKCFQ